jgi:hypothetical protein
MPGDGDPGRDRVNRPPAFVSYLDGDALTAALTHVP